MAQYRTDVSLAELTEGLQAEVRATREEIDPEIGFQLFGVLTPSECERLIAKGEELGFESLEGLYNPRYRSNTRILIKDEEFAQLIWQRVSHFLPPVIATKLETWDLVGINEAFRFCRYEPGQLFRPHCDEPYQPSENLRSFLTFMVYLNEVGPDAGGATVFLSHEEAIAQPTHLIHPSTGMALIFHQDRFHEGQQLLSGRKYMIRSEFMYQKRLPKPVYQWREIS
eukprot:TRINITY_DN7118_c0_g2_i1.p1 TRINITY_DN7118_c0_g2~~TRINITY_DN7118_c0_g2_i1.p1  ORF type:complete len:226 (+),score=51.68 TRINITY_DN7118_c0_g2_i1:96-773(+)